MEQDKLLSLLNFEHCNNEEDVFTHGRKVATELLNNWKIVAPSGERRLLGLEFYIYIKGVFEDDAVHCREEQLRPGVFYFHTKSKDGWTPPIFNRHGVDITCGNQEKGIYGGILLRHLGGQGHRDGSGLALRSLVRGDVGFRPIKRGSSEGKWSKEEIEFLTGMNEKPVFGCELSLVYDPLDEKIEVFPKRRIGITGTKYETAKLRFTRA